MLVLAAGHGADVGLLGGQVRGDPILEVVPGQVVLISNKYFHMFTNIFWCVCKYFYLQVPVGVLGCSLELADGADLDSVLSGVARNSWGKMSKLVIKMLQLLSMLVCQIYIYKLYIFPPRSKISLIISIQLPVDRSRGMAGLITISAR